ncbi:ABC transporter ATP-binding protein [Candidatus Daviesbacteria bacterium]|nr:ABC transporter ATP-binding protein [Candidatus Daviesbacteria bacterium]
MFKTRYSEKFTKLKSTIITSGRLIRLFWSIDKRLFIFYSIAVTLPALVPFAIAYNFKLIIDQIVPVVSGGLPDYKSITALVAAAVLLYTLQSIVFSIQDYFLRLINTKIPIALYQKVLLKVSSLDLAYFDDSEFKNTLEKVRDSYAWRPLNMIQYIFFTFQGFVQMAASMVILFSLSPVLILVILVVAVPEFINRTKQSELSWVLWDENSPNRKKFWYLSWLLQDRNAIADMKIFRLPAWFLGEMRGLHENFYKKNRDLATKYLFLNMLFDLFSGIVFVGILVFIIMQSISKKITIGDISYFTTAVSNFQNGVAGFFRNLVNMFETSLYVSSMFEVLDKQPLVAERENPIKRDFNKTPAIEFKNISFTYPATNKKVFDNFSLTVDPGEKVALVGENGAGKTTLVKLLARFYDVDSGEILVDGVSLKDLELESWWKSLGVLFQDYSKYEYSVRENIFFGRVWGDNNLADIKDAVKNAGAKSMVEDLEENYDQMLGRTFEGGQELSGGQWQKVALARAFFRNAPVLILDEPTAALDAKAESEVFNRVERLSKDKTVIIISHRFSTVRNADKIYVIGDGKIVESGSHKELIKLNGQYAGLFKLQAKGYQ